MLRLVLLSVLLLIIRSPAAADERADFLAAEQALAQGDAVRYAELAGRLRDYPLYPYLRFAELTRDLDAASEGDIRSFLDADPDSPLSARFRRNDQ